MKLTTILAAAALAITVNARPASAGYDKEDVLEDLQNAMYRVSIAVRPPVQSISEGLVGSTGECIELADLAIEKGGASDKVAVHEWVTGSTKRAEPFADRTHEIDPAGARAFCQALRQEHALPLLRGNKFWFDHAREAVEKKDGDFIKLAKHWAGTCLELAGHALASNPPDTDVGGTRLADIKTAWCKPLADAAGILESEINAAEAAKLAPYKKVLKGGKLKTFVDDDLVDIKVFGKGGTLLDSPRALAKASLWFVVLGKKGPDGKDWWILRRYQFKGDKFVKVTEKDGKGSWPPKSAYR